MQILSLLSRGSHPPRLHEPHLSDGAWELIQSCWVREALKRPGIDEVMKWIFHCQCMSSTLAPTFETPSRTPLSPVTSSPPSPVRQRRPPKLANAFGVPLPAFHPPPSHPTSPPSTSSSLSAATCKFIIVSWIFDSEISSPAPDNYIPPPGSIQRSAFFNLPPNSSEYAFAADICDKRLTYIYLQFNRNCLERQYRQDPVPCPPVTQRTYQLL
jgi:hypothetical protein